MLLYPSFLMSVLTVKKIGKKTVYKKKKKRRNIKQNRSERFISHGDEIQRKSDW